MIFRKFPYVLALTDLLDFSLHLLRSRRDLPDHPSLIHNLKLPVLTEWLALNNLLGDLLVVALPGYPNLSKKLKSDQLYASHLWFLLEICLLHRPGTVVTSLRSGRSHLNLSQIRRPIL